MHVGAQGALMERMCSENKFLNWTISSAKVRLASAGTTAHLSQRPHTCHSGINPTLTGGNGSSEIHGIHHTSPLDTFCF